MSRAKGTPATLNEMLGDTGGNMVSMKNLPKVLGHHMPELEFSPVGKLRLLHSLQNRFGDNFRQVPGVRDTLSEFDKHVTAHQVIANNLSGGTKNNMGGLGG